MEQGTALLLYVNFIFKFEESLRKVFLGKLPGKNCISELVFKERGEIFSVS